MNPPPRIHVVTFHSLAGVPLEEHGVTGDYLRVLREMFEDVRVLSVDTCRCSHCSDERARYLAEPELAPVPNGRQGRTAVSDYKPRCQERIPDGTFRGRTCAHAAVAGSAFCKVHQPEAKQARLARRREAWRIQADQRQQIASDGHELLSALGVDGHADSDGNLRITHNAARAILARLEALADHGDTATKER